ncbi:cytochrome b/b6 domain-containing protein [Limobrevibacterium gyesilva]|uniref:Cytochrome b/b6 domain-containing protein n=1 Tax=Limobrevibacterium gyesilva TaxID=2991712 RepID=A0AA41YPT5_9PROT|nr:cytochrome b/b6 domain-containing protein [Limobrevibacterium gyesilva]MCW3476501.1 cytochrome b/b6 domain-containing protein [Limobrevibacterium gyesilva]
MRVWDAPTRLFHWLLVILVVLSYVSTRLSWMDLHLLSGYAILTLLIFRIAWGFLGSDTARFSHFLRSPLAALRQLGRMHRREPDTQVGHSAAGGWMVVILLALLSVQAGTGLFANDDGATEGPLMKFVSKADSDWLSKIHGINFNILLAAIGLHLAAIAVYAVVKRHSLVKPMITGKKRLPAATPAPRMAHPLKALVILLIAGTAVWVLATRV